MANYSLTKYSTGEKNTVDEALEALHDKLETIDSTKNIRGIGVELLGRDRQKCVGWVIYDT